jgi:hypothetical protein
LEQKVKLHLLVVIEEPPHERAEPPPAGPAERRTER